MTPRRRGRIVQERRRGAEGGPPPGGDADDPERSDYGPGFRRPEAPDLPAAAVAQRDEEDEGEERGEEATPLGGPYEGRLHRAGRGDDQIRRAVEAALFYDTWVDADRIRVEVEDGVVTLRGSLNDAAEIRRAESDVRAVPGTREVRSELRIESRRAADRSRSFPG